METGNPIRGGAAYLECAFEVTVEMFYYAVGLRMEAYVVLMRKILRKVERLCQREEMNWGTWSEVIVCGRPKQEIQDEQGATCKEVTEVNERGAASAQHVMQSMMVRIRVCP